MDEPIIYTPYTKKDFNSIDKLTLVQRFCIALSNDDKPAFMSLISDPGSGGVPRSLTIDNIFNFDPLEIARAVLNGETPCIDTEDLLKDGMTPLHLAVICDAPRLTKYFLENGGVVDAVSNNKIFKHKDATPISCCTNLVKPSKIHTPFNLLWWLCYHERARIEIIRLFIQTDQHTWAREAFLNFAQKGELRKLAALFLAAPELFFPLLNKLNNKLNLFELKTRVKDELSLLLDVFALVGHKLAAYIRLEDFARKSCTEEEIMETMLEVESFIREAAIKKHGDGDDYVDYYLRFFEAEHQNCYDDVKENPDYYMDSEEEWDRLTCWLKGNDIYNFLPYMLRRWTGLKRLEIHRLIPTLESQNPVRAGILTRSIEEHVAENENPVRPAILTRAIEEHVAENENPVRAGILTRAIEEHVAENEVYVAAENAAVGEEEIVDAGKEAIVDRNFSQCNWCERKG